MGKVVIHVSIEIDGDGCAADRAAKLVEGMPGFFQHVIAERADQDRQWGGPEHDDSLDPADWEDVIASHVARLTSAVNGAPEADYFTRLIKIVALAVAASQSYGRLEAAKVKAFLAAEGYSHG